MDGVLMELVYENGVLVDFDQLVLKAAGPYKAVADGKNKDTVCLGEAGCSREDGLFVNKAVAW